MTKKKTPVEEKIRAFETFRRIDTHEAMQWRFSEPYCFNGIVAVKKYLVTIEEVEEGPEVYRARLQELWDRGNSHQNLDSISHAANKMGFDLQGLPGTKREGSR